MPTTCAILHVQYLKCSKYICVSLESIIGISRHSKKHQCVSENVIKVVGNVIANYWERPVA